MGAVSVIWTAQEQLAQLLTDAGLPTDAEVPSRATGARRYVIQGSPWIAAGQTLGSRVLRLRVICVADKGTPEVQVAQLGDMVLEVLLALEGQAVYRIDSGAVEQPAEMAGAALGAAINIFCPLSRAQLKGTG